MTWVWFLGLKHWKERTDFCRVPSDCTCTVTWVHVPVHIHRLKNPGTGEKTHWLRWLLPGTWVPLWVGDSQLFIVPAPGNPTAFLVFSGTRTVQRCACRQSTCTLKNNSKRMWWCMLLISAPRRKAETDGSLSSRPAWSAGQVSEQPRLHRKTLSQKSKIKQKSFSLYHDSGFI